MNADMLRELYNYHFAMNRFVWEQYIAALTPEQFTQGAEYSRGSVRNQMVHIMNTDEAWFSGLRGMDLPESVEYAAADDRERIRERWDQVEQEMREYLSMLRDEMLSEKPLSGEDKDLLVWQVLLHVVNHGTDHRAQVLRTLHDLGVNTTSQDYIFYVYEHM
jgi:uncharacterized damage-inducible protein DinB